MTGTPFSITASGSSLNTPGETQTANQVGSVQLEHGINTGNLWFSTSSFSQPTGVVFGTSGRNILSGPGLFALNASLFKNFKIRERATIELRCETFNLTNSPQFANPSASTTSSTYGYVTQPSQRYRRQRHRRRPCPATGGEGFILKHRREKSNTQLPLIRPARNSRLNLGIALAIFVATVALYAPVARFDFVNFDDPEYVTRNTHVRGGLTQPGLEWALTSGEAANWFPVTRLSHMLDSQFFGLRGGLHHLTSVWCTRSPACCYSHFWCARPTRAGPAHGSLSYSRFIPARRIGRVGGGAQRRLCAFFWFLALWAYVRYGRRPGRGRYLAVLLWFILGLMSKPMIVTLPFLLLVLDAWPLRRLRERR